MPRRRDAGHKKVAEIGTRRRGGPNRGLSDAMSEQEQMEFLDHFTDVGLEPGILNVTASDLVFFNTALYHGTWCAACVLLPLVESRFLPSHYFCGSMAEDQAANGPNELLRTIFIQSMVPSSLFGQGKGDDEPPLTTDHRNDVLLARRCAYEKSVVTGGSIVNPARARQILTTYEPAFGGAGQYADPTNTRNLADADAITQRLVCPGMVIEENGIWAAEEERAWRSNL
jgi:hypothetical protein